MCYTHTHARTHARTHAHTHTHTHTHTYIYVTGFGKTDHIVTIDILRNTDLKYRSRHGSLVLDCSHARFAVSLEQSFG